MSRTFKILVTLSTLILFSVNSAANDLALNSTSEAKAPDLLRLVCEQNNVIGDKHINMVFVVEQTSAQIKTGSEILANSTQGNHLQDIPGEIKVYSGSDAHWDWKATTEENLNRLQALEPDNYDVNEEYPHFRKDSGVISSLGNQFTFFNEHKINAQRLKFKFDNRREIAAGFYPMASFKCIKASVFTPPESRSELLYDDIYTENIIQ